jgi:hypothetical protein
MLRLKRKIRAYTVGVDLHLPSLRDARKMNAHSDYIAADVRKLPIKEKSVDGVLCSQVIEHLMKAEGSELVDSLERTARIRVLIATPVGFIPYVSLRRDTSSNPLQVHKSGWTPNFFRLKGYSVRFQGLRVAYRPGGLMHKIGPNLSPLFFPLWYLFSFLTYHVESMAAYQIAWKDLRLESTLRGKKVVEGPDVASVRVEDDVLTVPSITCWDKEASRLEMYHAP